MQPQKKGMLQILPDRQMEKNVVKDVLRQCLALVRLVDFGTQLVPYRDFRAGGIMFIQFRDF